MNPVATLLRTLLPVLLLVAGTRVSDASTWNLAYGGSNASSQGSSWGNQLTFSKGGQQLKVSAWADTGSAPAGSFETAYLGRFSTGLGVCNRGEGSITACIDAGLDHQVDNVGQQDLVLFLFDTPQAFTSLTIDPWGVWDRDVSFWVGTVAPNLSLAGASRTTLVALGFGPQVDSFNSAGESALSISLGGRVGNALIVSALFPADASPDRFKIKSLVTTNATVVPLPATMWLLVSALGSLAGVRRLR